MRLLVPYLPLDRALSRRLGENLGTGVGLDVSAGPSAGGDSARRNSGAVNAVRRVVIFFCVGVAAMLGGTDRAVVGTST